MNEVGSEVLADVFIAVSFFLSPFMSRLINYPL